MAPRTKRIRFLIVVVALVALVGVAHLALRRVATGPLRTRIEKNLTQALGLEVSLDELEIALLPMLHLDAEGMRVAHPPGRATPELLEVDHIYIGVELWPLLKRSVVIDALEIQGADLHLERDADGHFAGKLELGSLVDDKDEDSVHFELRKLNIEALRVFYTDARSKASHSLILDSFTMDSRELGSEIAVDLQGKYEGSPIAVSGQIGSLRELLKRTKPFSVDLKGRLFESDFEAKGTVLEPWTLTGLDVEISAQIPKLIVQDHLLPELGTIRFGGHLSDLDGSLGLEKLSLDSTKTVPVRLAVRGKVDDLIGLKQVEVDVDIETVSLAFLKPLLQPRVEFPLPTIASLSAKAKFSNQDGQLDLDGTIDAVTDGDAIVMHAKGGVRDLMGVAKIDVELEAHAKDLASVTSLFPEFPKHGTFGPLTSSARLRSHDGGLAASGIVIRLGDRKRAWVELDATIANVVAFRDVDLQLEFGAQSLHHLKELLTRELPRTSAFEGSAAISDSDGSLGIEHLRLHGGEGSPVEIHLEAKFDDLPNRKEIEVELGFTGEDSQVLGAIAGIDLPMIKPVHFHGVVKGSEEHLEVERMTLRLGETRLLGVLSGSFAPPARPSVKARLTSKDVRMQDLGLAEYRAASSPSSSTDPSSSVPQKGARPPARTLPFERLRHVDLDLGLRFDHVGGYQGLDATDVGFMLKLEDGDLVVTDAGARYQGGDLTAKLHVDARTPQPKLDAELHTKALHIERVMSQFDDQTDYSGILDADIDLHARGETLDALRQSLAGNVAASMRDGNAASKIAREFVVNVATIVFPKWLSKIEKDPSIGCAILDLEIEDGIASVRNLLLRGEDVGIVGTGEIDLVHGLYDLHVVPKAKRPGILSVAPEVHVGGPLDAPQFHAVKRTLVTSFGRGLWHSAFRAGKTLLLPFGKRSSKRVEDCRAASPTTG
jgi:uncharacterized protein involved in outer membrane biogenesis